MSDDKKPPRAYRTDLHQFSFRANPRLTGIIKDMSAERHSSYSDSIRLLIGLGLQIYEENKVAGRTTGEKNQMERTKRMAEAELIAAIKSKGKDSAIPLLTPMLFGNPEPDE